eukprot:TRINITY_DN1748_c0_g2_i2.p1 TRINITY_DN1748_c0_g2~~TRINITY_DN1748_c0_g2_i2.p1  ORF type:complete len:231 (-),score=17.50 TRINITY_DN1748_c0_g2_i2:422-1114(-)
MMPFVVILLLLPLVLSDSVSSVQRLHFSQAGPQTYSFVLLSLYDVSNLRFDFSFGPTYAVVPNTTLNLDWTLQQNGATIFTGTSYQIPAGVTFSAFTRVDPCPYMWLQNANSNPNIFWNGILTTSSQVSGDFNVSQTIERVTPLLQNVLTTLSGTTYTYLDITPKIGNYRLDISLTPSSGSTVQSIVLATGQQCPNAWTVGSPDYIKFDLSSSSSNHLNVTGFNTKTQFS